MNVVRPLHSRCSASWILDSVSVSTALVASCETGQLDLGLAGAMESVLTSRSTIFGCFKMARAIATLCNSPPDSFIPRSPTRVP